MSTQELVHAKELSQLEAFRAAVWGNKSFIKRSSRTSGSNTRTIEYLDFSEHLAAVQSFCHAVSNEKVIVFEEYRTAMRKFKEDDKMYEKGASIIGQSGLGKTCFIAYGVVERLREELPVAIQLRWSTHLSQYLLFTSDSVTLHEDGDTLLRHHNPIWAFSDATANISIPTLAFLNAECVRTFQTTPPARHNWKDWTKQRKVNLYTMDVPSFEEVEDLAFILGKDVERMKTLAEKWGPIPRVLLRILKVPLIEEVLEQDVRNGVNEVIGRPSDVFSAIADPDSSATLSEPIFFIKSEERSRCLHSACVPTRWLVSQLVEGLVRETEDARTKFFNSMSIWDNVLSGSVFEEIAQCFLTCGENFTIRWYDQEIGTGGPVLTIPLSRFNLFESDVTGRSGSTDIAEEDDGDYKNDGENQDVHTSK